MEESDEKGDRKAPATFDRVQTEFTWNHLPEDIKEGLEPEIVEQIVETAPIEMIAASAIRDEIETDHQFQQALRRVLFEIGALVAISTVLALVSLGGIWYGLTQGYVSITALSTFFVFLIIYHLWRYRMRYSQWSTGAE